MNVSVNMEETGEFVKNNDLGDSTIISLLVSSDSDKASCGEGQLVNLSESGDYCRI